MPPIPVYTHSPIAAKPSGVTPQTVSAADQTQKDAKPPTITAAPTQAQTSYPQAKPGAVPTLPTATATSQARAAYMPPTPTRNVQGNDGPPPPEPGAAPRPTRTTHLPPPPKDGEKYVPSPQSAAVPYPQQMSIPAPTLAYPAQQSGTSSAVASAPTYGGQGGGQDLQHPPGYHQNVNASGLDNYQRSAMDRNDSEYQQHGVEGDGVWNSAKKWAAATGEKLVAAETEVWKRINKE